ncbi:MAG: helix-hairpin-helix domain-containing protein [bacterium]|uniref:ComEA protein n=2 Tax=Bacteria candidate phyla TaxID=1783234 RepID=A0A101I2Z8_UNCT6|nr:MAG: ComEA protein [candidate division TA06 bacterium 32_111]KUK87811.1 MAG: ComEA protein [candidate division TA06 bacterium 34_109]MDI6700656.1 helix-hairpin-helix domain-containing protein [bacterium]HAF07965.1 hypothetical protein [candidate division WOR-3 bacterium]HCP16333.1 hypothetical protein [candidate division WOR-3 bacterium]
MGGVFSKKTFLTLIFFLLYLQTFSATFLSSDLNFCNDFEDLLALSREKSYDYITFGCSNRFFIKNLNNFYSFSNFNFKNFSSGHLLIADLNDIFKSYTLSFKLSYNYRNVKVGVAPYTNFIKFSDGMNKFSNGIIVSAMIMDESFYILPSYILKKKQNSSSLILGYCKNGYDIQFQTSYGNGFVFTGRVIYDLYGNVKLNFSIDSEKRIFFGLKFVKFPYFLEYTTFIHPYLSNSNDIRFSIFKENRYYDLPYIKINRVHFDIPLKIKKIKGFYRREKIDLNKAFYEEILSIEGLTKTALRRIYIFRLINGKINSYDQLEKLHGIGKKSIEKLKEQTFIGE